MLNILSERVDPLKIKYTKFLDLKDYIIFFSFNTINPKIIKVMKSDLSITQKDFVHDYKSCSNENSNMLFYNISYNESVNLFYIVYFSLIGKYSYLVIYSFKLDEFLTITNGYYNKLFYNYRNSPFFDFIISLGYNSESKTYKYKYNRHIFNNNENNELSELDIAIMQHTLQLLLS